MTLYKWSQTALADATADSTVNWAEGQSPSSVNDSARAMMAATAKYRDDVSGYLTTGGTATAFTLATNQVFDTLAHMDKQTLTVVFHATSGATPTLAVDSLTAKPIRHATGGTLPTGVLVAGTPYRLTYYNSVGEFLIDGSPVASAIIAGGVTYAAIQNETNNTILGNVSGGAASPQEITIGTGLVVSGTTLTAPAFPPSGAFKNLSIKVASNTTVTVAADFVTMTDGTNFLTHSLSGTINLGTNGAPNALDAGTVAIDTWYAIWSIAKADGTTSAIASENFGNPTLPTLPVGYTYYARVGAVRTTHASATLYGTWQLGRRAQYVVGLAQTSGIRQISQGAVGTYSDTSPTWGAVSVSSAVPPTASAVNVYINNAFNGGVNSNIAVAPNGSYSGRSTANPPPMFLNPAMGYSDVAWLLLESTNIYVSAGSGTYCGCLGWEENI